MTTPTHTVSADPQPTETTVIGRFLIAALALPIFATLAAIAAQLAARGDLPDQIATHWGPNGQPDSFMSPTASLVMTAAIGLLIPIAIAASAVPGLRSGARGSSYRAIGATAAGLSTFIAVLTTWLTLAQRGLDDASHADLPVAALFAAAAAGLAVGTLGWFIQPHQKWIAPEGSLEPLRLDASERAVWFGEAAASTWFVAIVGVSTATIWGLVLWQLLFVEHTAVVWMSGAIAVVVTAALATTTAFRVRVDRSGLLATASVGWPRFRVPIDDVASVSTRPIDPMGEFGGFGLRNGKGVFAIALRRGDGIEITRTNGRRFVITVDDAPTAAALLNAFAHFEA